MKNTRQDDLPAVKVAGNATRRMKRRRVRAPYYYCGIEQVVDCSNADQRRCSGSVKAVCCSVGGRGDSLLHLLATRCSHVCELSDEDEPHRHGAAQPFDCCVLRGCWLAVLRRGERTKRAKKAVFIIRYRGFLLGDCSTPLKIDSVSPLLSPVFRPMFRSQFRSQVDFLERLVCLT